jgi:prepilin-type processing-associated H-X9-DG protein
MIVNYAVAGKDFPAAAPGPAHVFSSAPGRLVMGRSNYVGMGGYYSPTLYPQYQGLFTYLSKNAVSRVPDGTSNTVLFGEIAGGYHNWNNSGGIPAGVMGYAWTCGFNYSGFGVPYAGNVSATVNGHGVYDPGTGNELWGEFSSQHTNVVNFGFADGSVRTISPTIDFATWVYITGFQDGVVVTFN